MKEYEITTVDDHTEYFTGEYLGQKHPEAKEISKNWHYYKSNNGEILHFRSDKITMIKEEKV